MRIVLGLPEGLLHAAPTLVALGQGYFQEHGLDVEAINAGSHYSSIPMIANGDVDVSPQGGLIDFYRSWDAEQPMKWVAYLSSQCEVNVPEAHYRCRSGCG